MSGAPEISIVIVNWNTCELLRNCLRSLKADLESGLCELIVIDNAEGKRGLAAMVAAEFPSVA
jgi:GT2 family glycosyltransferase